MAAVREGRLEILEILLKAGASQPACEEALLEASCHGRAKHVELLMGSDLIRAPVVVHALVTSCCRGFLDVVESLLKCGVNVNATDRVLLQSSMPALHTNVDCTALTGAVVSRQVSIVRLLLQGTMIQLKIFGKSVAQFKDFLWYGKTYFISDGCVRPIDKRFDNVHQHFELRLTEANSVLECESKVTKHAKYSFISFKEASSHGENRQIFSILGVVIVVKPPVPIKNKENGTTRTFLRDVIIKDKSEQCLRISLWGDLAESEGRILEDMATLKPLIAISGVTGNNYGGEFSIKTTSVTSIQINPDIPEAKELQAWVESFLGEEEDIGFCTPPSRFKNSQELALQDIIDGRIPKQQGLHCYFKAVIDELVDKNEQWYKACRKCNRKVQINDDGVHCERCNSDYAEWCNRYKVIFKVSDGDAVANVTLFDVAEMITKCPIAKFIEEKEERRSKSDSYLSLIHCIGKDYKFMMRLSPNKANQGPMCYLVAEEIEEIDDQKKVEDEIESPMKKSRTN